MGLVTGLLTLKDQLFPKEEEKKPTVVVAPRDRGEIPRFDGIAGHLAESRALLDFLGQHDDEVVYLEVGFPKLGTGPGGGENVVVRKSPP